MAKRKRRDDMGRDQDPRGDYYPESEGGMVDPRPQRRRGGRGDDYGEVGGGGYDSYGGPQQAEQKGGAGKAVVKALLTLFLMLAAFAGGSALSLTLAGKGALPDFLSKAFHVAKPVADEDNLATYDEDVADAVRSGKVREMLDEEAESTPEDEMEGAYGTATDTASGNIATDPYASSATGATTVGTQTTDPTQQQVAVDPNAQQQVATDPNAQQVQQQQVVTDPNAQQQVAVDPNAQQQVQQQVVDPTAQQQ